MTFKRPQPLSIRLWHWLNGLVVLGLLLTVLLRKTVLSWRANSALIEAKIQDAGGSIESGLAADIAKSIRNVMWEWHINLGLALAALLVWRVGAGLLTGRTPLRDLVAGFRAWSQAQGQAKRSALHLAVVKVLHALFYLGLLFMAATGLSLHYAGDLGLSKATLGSIKEAHELGMWPIAVFVAAHLIGVIYAELTHSRGIVSDMIHGGEE